MSQPVKLSDGLVLDARVAGEALQRSIARQVEFWAGLGKAIEPILQGDRVLALCRNGQSRPLSACLEGADSPSGRKRPKACLTERPYPHYEPATGAEGLLVRIEANGTRTVGRFINRVFRAAKGTRNITRAGK